MRDFEQNFFRLVRFRINFSTTRQILNYNFYDASDFQEEKFLKSTIFKKKTVLKADFEKSFAHEESSFDSIYPVKCANFALYVHFYKA